MLFWSITSVSRKSCSSTLASISIRKFTYHTGVKGCNYLQSTTSLASSCLHKGTLNLNCNQPNVGSSSSAILVTSRRGLKLTGGAGCPIGINPALANRSEKLPTKALPSSPIMASQANNFSTSSPNSSGNQSSAESPKTKFVVSRDELKARLSPIQYQVTQLKATERPFTGEYNKFNGKGTYHCVVCNESLFESNTKFESGCGWPAFFDTIDKSKLKFVQDYALVGAGNLLRLANNPDLIRTEVLCKNCDAHLGHRFDDGPLAKGGKRYCINSAAMRFEPNSTETTST